jgi:hypothetical protein
MTSRPPVAALAEDEDPWVAGYLRLRQAVLDSELRTPEEIAAYAAELRAGLPGQPPPAIAAFIAADIRITFPVLADQLWTPPSR